MTPPPKPVTGERVREIGQLRHTEGGMTRTQSKKAIDDLLSFVATLESKLSTAQGDAIEECAARALAAGAEDSDEPETDFDRALIALLTYKPTGKRNAYELFADAIRALTPKEPIER